MDEIKQTVIKRRKGDNGAKKSYTRWGMQGQSRRGNAEREITNIKDNLRIPFEKLLLQNVLNINYWMYTCTQTHR